MLYKGVLTYNYGKKYLKIKGHCGKTLTFAGKNH